MSTEPDSQPQEPSAPAPQQHPAAAPKKARSPVERIVVWGVILALAVVAALEARARFGYSQTLSALEGAMKQQEESESDLLTLANAEKLFSGSPAKSEPKAHGLYQQVVYTWSGLFKKYTITLTFEGVKDAIDAASPDYSPLLLSFETNTENSDHQEILFAHVKTSEGDPEAEETEPMSETSPSADSGGTGAEGSGSAGPGDGAPGGRGRFTLERIDENGDGKITEDEAPGRMKQNFAEIDANGDGGVDAEEFAAIRRRRSESSETPAEGAGSNAPFAPDESPSRETPAASAAEKPVSAGPEPSNPPSSDAQDEPAPPPLPQ